MPKRKSAAKVLVADGSGGMREVSDLRFEVDGWPIHRVIEGSQADAWMAQLHAEIEDRGWSGGGIAQADAQENSGSLTISTASGTSPPSIAVVWERKRNGRLIASASPAGDPPLELDATQQFFASVDNRHREGRTNQSWRRDYLGYQGLPWRGEIWLQANLRLGPPSRFPDWLVGP